MYTNEEINDINRVRRHGNNHTPTTFVGLIELQNQIAHRPAATSSTSSGGGGPMFDDSEFGIFARILLFFSRLATFPASLYAAWRIWLFMAENVTVGQGWAFFNVLLLPCLSLVAGFGVVMILGDALIKMAMRQCPRVFLAR